MYTLTQLRLGFNASNKGVIKDQCRRSGTTSNSHRILNSRILNSPILNNPTLNNLRNRNRMRPTPNNHTPNNHNSTHYPTLRNKPTPNSRPTRHRRTNSHSSTNTLNNSSSLSTFPTLNKGSIKLLPNKSSNNTYPLFGLPSQNSQSMNISHHHNHNQNPIQSNSPDPNNNTDLVAEGTKVRNPTIRDLTSTIKKGSKQVSWRKTHVSSNVLVAKMDVPTTVTIEGEEAMEATEVEMITILAMSSNLRATSTGRDRVVKIDTTRTMSRTVNTEEERAAMYEN